MMSNLCPCYNAYHFILEYNMLLDGLLFYREIDEAALEQALAAAVTCTILAAAGPQRSRVLATLYKVRMQGLRALIFSYCYFQTVLSS